MTEPTDKCPACVNNIPTTKTKVGENLLLCDKHRSEIDGYLMQVIKDNPDPTLLDSEIDLKLKEILGFDDYQYTAKPHHIKALIATIGNEVIGQDAWGCYQHPQPNDGCSSESCEAGIHINEKLATQRSRLQELINGR